MERVDNVLPFRNKPTIDKSSKDALTPLYDVERIALIKSLRETADNQPTPIDELYRALAFMLEENASPSDLMMDYPIGAINSDLLLRVFFTTQPGDVVTTLKAVKGTQHRYSTAEEEKRLGVVDIENAFHVLTPDLTMYKVFALKPSRSLVGAILSMGGELFDITQTEERTIFYFGYHTANGTAEVTVTIFIPL